MNFKIIFVLCFLMLPLILVAQNAPQIATVDSSQKYLSSADVKQDIQIQKLDSNITHLKNENAYLKELAEQDIQHANSLINSTETIVGFIAILLGVFSVVGGYIITKMFKQSSQIGKDHKKLLDDWEATRKEIDELKELSIKEGKELLQILFYITEGDNRIYNKTADAIEFYKEALKIRDKNPQVYAKLGRAYYIIGDFDKAVTHFVTGYQLNPNDTSILNGLARIYTAEQNYDEAEKFFKKVLEIDPQDNVALWGLGHNYLFKRDYNNAEIYYIKSLHTDSPFFSNFNLAFVYACKRNEEKSIDHAMKTMGLIETKFLSASEPDWVLGRKAIIYILLKKFEDAKKTLNSILKKYPDSTVINYIYTMLKILDEVYENDQIKDFIKILPRTDSKRIDF